MNDYGRITLKGFNMDITGIDYLGIDRVLKRGTGEIIENHANTWHIMERFRSFLLIYR